MQVTCIYSGGRVSLTVMGELALETAERFSAACTQIPPEATQVCLDLGGLTFLDSTGANALLQAALEWTDAHIKLHIENLGDDVREMLDILGFFDVLAEQA